MTQTRDGTIWVISESGDSGISRFDGKNWSSVQLMDKGGLDINTSILETKDGTLWIGSHRGRLHALRDGEWTFYSPPDIPSSKVRIADLLQTREGAIWMVAQGQEALRLDYSTSSWRVYKGLNFLCETQDGAR